MTGYVPAWAWACAYAQEEGSPVQFGINTVTDGGSLRIAGVRR